MSVSKQGPHVSSLSFQNTALSDFMAGGMDEGWRSRSAQACFGEQGVCGINENPQPPNKCLWIAKTACLAFSEMGKSPD